MEPSARIPLLQHHHLAVVVWSDVGAGIVGQHGEGVAAHDARDPEPFLPLDRETPAILSAFAA
ncbi:hypothetical protein D3C86_1867620 [compost metagenome]